MPVIRKRKPFRVGDSIAVSLPPGHTLADEKTVVMLANNVVLIYPDSMSKRKVKNHARELLESVK